jgi:hypothetical protein
MVSRVDWFASLRKKETLIGHTLIEQDRCVYCGALVTPHLNRRSGSYRNLDHFIPIDIMIVVSAGASSEKIPNFLLPCCPRCNYTLGECFFPSLVEKFDYRSDRVPGRRGQWHLDDNPQFQRLLNIAAPENLLSMIKPIEEVHPRDRYSVLVPEQHGRWERVEKALSIQCNHRTFCGGL